MKALVLLSGCGVFDGSEIHESVSTLICLKKNSIDYECTSLNIDMHHVLNHTNGKEINEKRNVLIESSRISRGNPYKIPTFSLPNFYENFNKDKGILDENLKIKFMQGLEKFILNVNGS